MLNHVDGLPESDDLDKQDNDFDLDLEALKELEKLAMPSLQSLSQSVRIDESLWRDFMDLNENRPEGKRGLLICPGVKLPLFDLSEKEPESRQLMYYIDFSAIDWSKESEAPPVEEQGDIRLELCDQQIGNRFHEMIVVQLTRDGEIRYAQDPFRAKSLSPEAVEKAVNYFLQESVDAVVHGKKGSMPSWLEDDGRTEPL